MRSNLFLIALALGCAGRGTPVAVTGPVPADVAQLVGAWVGSYESPESGRSGSIRFALTAVGDTAWGDVVMAPADEQAAPLWTGSRPARMQASVVLPIRFVRIAGDRVQGMLEPYRDPACGCRVVTVFTGVLRNQVIMGEFVTRHQEHAREVRGTWWVELAAPAP